MLFSLDRLRWGCSIVSQINFAEMNSVSNPILDVVHSFNPPLIHGNLKAANVLINDQGEAVIADYGLSSLIASTAGPTSFTSSAFASSVRWMAFELLRPAVGQNPVLSAHCDMWSFGSLMLEVRFDPSSFSQGVIYRSLTVTLLLCLFHL